MPANDGLGEDDDEKLLPVGPELSYRDPEQFVGQIHLRSWVPTFEDGQLLSQDNIL